MGRKNKRGMMVYFIKNFRKLSKSQAIVEYIALLLIILGAFAAFLNNVKGHLDNYHKGMASKISGSIVN